MKYLQGLPTWIRFGETEAHNGGGLYSDMIEILKTVLGFDPSDLIAFGVLMVGALTLLIILRVLLVPQLAKFSWGILLALGAILVALSAIAAVVTVA